MRHHSLLLSMLTIGLAAPLGLAQGVDRPPTYSPANEYQQAPDVSLVVDTAAGVAGRYFEPFSDSPNVQVVSGWKSATFEVVAPLGSPYVLFVGGPRDHCQQFSGIRGGLAVGNPLLVLSVGVTAQMNGIPKGAEVYCTPPDYYFGSAKFDHRVPAQLGAICVRYQAVSLCGRPDKMSLGFSRPTEMQCR